MVALSPESFIFILWVGVIFIAIVAGDLADGLELVLFPLSNYY